MSKVVLTDTGFWIGLLDPRDNFHETSITISELLEDNIIIFPWPCLYETISTRLTRRRDQLLHLEQMLSKPNIKIFEDADYRDEALQQVFRFNRFDGFTHSLADSVIREILKDVNVKVNYLVTYNLRDFEDICIRRAIETIS